MAWVAAALCACGETAMQPTAGAPAAGAGGSYAALGGMGGEAQPDAAGPATLVYAEPVAGAGGRSAAPPVGGMAAGAAGKEGPPPPRPEAGSGGVPKPEMGGAPAKSMERVLWTQEWVVSIHDESLRSAATGDQMGLMISAGKGCEFGGPGPSGENRSYPTDGKCIGDMIGSAAGGVSVFSGVKPIAWRGAADLAGWTAATTGHTVLYLRRTQTYQLDLLSNGQWSYDYADFTGKWEAVGY